MDLSSLAKDSRQGLDHPVRVAVDAMGGDHAPEEIVHGALDWAKDHPDVHILLVGDEVKIKPFLGPSPVPDNVSLVQAGESVSMEEHPAQAVRRKRDASINVCMRLVKSGRADAVVTAGHTGAGVASAILFLGRLRGVDRPALAVQLVTDKGPMVLLDIGATTDSNGHNLAQYARMGAIFSEQVMGVTDPSVALLSIGEEGGKGETRVQEATELLSASDLRFIGNAEGKDLPKHPADVVVCDASVGNVVIKFFEGLSSFIFDQLRTEFRRAPWGPIGYLFMRPGHRAHPPALRLRAAGRRAAAGRQRHRTDHPRPSPSAHDRICRRGRSGSGQGQHPGSDPRCHGGRSGGSRDRRRACR